MSAEGQQYTLRDKLIITAKVTLVTGLHIGTGGDFSPIGAVDSPMIRDVITHRPIIPGSSIKGKLRTLLVKLETSGYMLGAIDNDGDSIKRLFGSAGKQGTRPARLQFSDVFMSQESFEHLSSIDTDTYLGEVKFENTINRITGIANPRQIERVPAGTVFDFRAVYNIEKEEEIKEDMDMLRKGILLLETDYIGGHGSRGYGRVAFSDFHIESVMASIDPSEYVAILQGE